MRELIAMFAAIFFAELGDKTQLATILFASEKKMAPLAVFAASAGALVLSSAIAVLLGTVASKYLAVLPLKLIAGIGFIVIGGLAIADYFRPGA
jgi:putative Ca2+/H+ antiporter (TMEM165/GDT1 family)